MPKKTKKKTADMLKKRRALRKTKKKAQSDLPASQSGDPSAITKIGNKIKNVAITTANEIIPEVPTKEVKIASREIGAKAGATAAAAGTAAATIGTAVIKKVKDDPAFRAAATNLGYTVLGTTQDGLLFLVNNNRLIRRPAMKIIKRGIKLAFIPAQTLGMLVLQAALTAASVVPPIAVAIKLYTAGAKLGWQVIRGKILMMKLAKSKLELSNNIIELILRFTNVVPMMTRNFRSIGLQTQQLMNMVELPPLPPIPPLYMTDTLKVFKPTQRKIERRLARIPNPITKVSERLTTKAVDALVPEGLGDVKLNQLPNKISKMGEKVQKQVATEAEKAGKQIAAALPTAVATPVTSPAPKGTPTATATPIKGGRRKRRRRTRKKRRRQRQRKYRTRRRRR